MKRNNRNRFLPIILVGLCTGFLSVLLVRLLNNENADSDLTRNFLLFLATAVAFVALICEIVTFLIRVRHDKYSEFDKYDKNIIKLNQLISYNRQRDEIEQEIGKITRELMNSDVAQYIDVNRLAFSGQGSNLLCGSINYSNFLKQFGLQENAITVKKGTATFLTPFNEEGNKLFMACQAILGKVNIFLRKTDNLVEKDDILMNIVSLIVQSEFILVNIDGRNPNVYYELGIAHAIGKPTILLSQTKFTSEDIGFDLRQKRIILYDNLQNLETKLLSQISMLNRNYL